MTDRSGPSPMRRRPESFDEELRRAARGFATTELPADLLSGSSGALPPESVNGSPVRAASRGVAVGALVVVILGLALWSNAPRLGVGSSPFRTTAAIEQELTEAGIRCRAGAVGTALPAEPAASPAPIEAAICPIPAASAPMRGGLTVLESPKGTIVEVFIKADVATAATADRETLLIETIRGLLLAATSDRRTGEEIVAWLTNVGPSTTPGTSHERTIGGIDLTFERLTATIYLLQLIPAGP